MLLGHPQVGLHKGTGGGVTVFTLCILWED